MKLRIRNPLNNLSAQRRVARWVTPMAVGCAVFLAGCNQITHPKAEPFYAQTPPPPIQEFRWSNGKSPKSFDPARAAAAPETDIVRAVYEGLTDLDAKSLKEVPGVAERWESSPDLKNWTFYLRKDARWSNDEPVTAYDFVRSWKRLANLKEKAANKYLFENIAGMKEPVPAVGTPAGGPTDFLHENAAEPKAMVHKLQTDTNSTPIVQASPPPESSPIKPGETAKKPEPAKFGVVAVDARTLRVSLETPDEDLPSLVANPVFRPIYGDGVEFNDSGLDADIVTNGAFRITTIAENGITLERAENYWNRKSVVLERVRFVPMPNAEKALEAYRLGQIDAVSNADFEPLALKLLTPYEDFRRTTHSALNFYEFNPKNIPFNDRRVREALAISIDRERLTEGELDGSTQPAYSFLPLGEPNVTALSLDVERAKDLLAKAGYPNGTNFPEIRLVVNRNDTQQRVAKTVAKMWRQNLNLDTLVVVKESSEIEKTRAFGEFDLIRRGAVMPTTDDLVSLTSVFGPLKKVEAPAAKDPKKGESPAEPRAEKTPTEVPKTDGPNPRDTAIENTAVKPDPSPEPTLSEEDSIFNIYAIPLYFPASYSLVKPYVRGFEMNGLDAPSLKEVSIDSNWQPVKPAIGS